MMMRTHVSTEGGCQLSSLTALGDTMTVWMDEGWAADVIYCHFSRAFGPFSCCVLVYKLSYHSLDGQPPGWLELEHLSCRVRLRDQGWFSQEIRRFWGHSKYEQLLEYTGLPRKQKQTHQRGTWWEDERQQA